MVISAGHAHRVSDNRKLKVLRMRTVGLCHASTSGTTPIALYKRPGSYLRHSNTYSRYRPPGPVRNSRLFILASPRNTPPSGSITTTLAMTASLLVESLSSSDRPLSPGHNLALIFTAESGSEEQATLICQMCEPSSQSKG